MQDFTSVKVARDEDFTEQIGKDIFFDLVNHDKVPCFRIQKELPFYTFKEQVEKASGIPVHFQRFWLWAKRQNLTYRPNRPLTHEEETQPIGQLREIPRKSENAELKLFLEVERHGRPPEICKEDLLIFFKLYDPAIEELRYVGRLFVKSTDRPLGILMKLNEMAGFLSSQEIELYEEIKFEPSVMCEPIEKKLMFRSSQLESGDIVCFQKTPTVGSGQQYRYPDVPSYLKYVHNRQVVYFRPLEKLNDEGFCLELSKLFNYDEVVKKVACQLGVDYPSKIRLTNHNCYTQKPGATPIKYKDSKHLSDMLLYCTQISDILYYEVLDAKLFTIIKVARNDDLAQQIGRDICFDLVNFDKVQCFCIMKETPFYDFKEEVAKEFGISVQFQRFWLWGKRENLTYRPCRPVTHVEETQPIGQLKQISQESQNAELNLFLELERHGPDFDLIQPPEICNEDILIFFKLYDPAIEELRYVGRLLVKSTGRPYGILMKLNEMAGFFYSQEIELYEEIKSEPSVMCRPIEKELTFQASQLENGDIVCFQKSPVAGNRQQYRYPDVPSYLEYVHNRLIVHFRALEEPTQAQFSLELSKLYTYEEIVTRVAFKLVVHDQSRIRLTPHDSSSNHPKPTPIKYEDMKQLSDILIDDNEATNILYYEVLEIPASRPSSCVVCLDAPLEGACVPCGHMSGCMLCLNEIKAKNMGCPVCRAEIQLVVRIYV